jgi:hypothetical protein
MLSNIVNPYRSKIIKPILVVASVVGFTSQASIKLLECISAIWRDSLNFFKQTFKFSTTT